MLTNHKQTLNSEKVYFSILENSRHFARVYKEVWVILELSMIGLKVLVLDIL